MNKLTLNFLVAYADIYNLQDQPVADVIERTLDFLNSDEFMEDFLKHYRLTKHYKLDHIVKECISYGMSFLEVWKEFGEWEI